MKFYITCFFICQTLVGSCQSSLLATIDSIIEKTKQISMYSASVNWDSLTIRMHQKAENAQSVEDLQPAFELMLNTLGDHHGRIMLAANYTLIGAFTDWDNIRTKDTREKDMDTWKIVNDTAAKFEYAILPNNIGYLKIMGIGPWVDMQVEATKIRGAISEMYNKDVEFWIIDLRFNAGGNMNPMVAGIAPLIGDGIVGYLTDVNHNILFEWEINQGNFIYDSVKAIDLPNQPQIKTNPKVAVLTSRWTTSSGEVVATTLKGRDNTRFFGEATGGFATNVSWEVINEEILLLISTGVYTDRNKIAYTINIPVDVELPFVIEKNISNDIGVTTAIKWLLEE